MTRTSWAALLLVAAGCATTQAAPTDAIATSLAAVRGAEEAGAKDVPQAALHLQLAEEQIARAKATKDGAAAEALAARANEDAELALALAREHQTKEKLAQATPNAQGAGGEQPPAAPSPQPNAAPTSETRTP